MNENMILWESVNRPPKEALKKIGGGRLSGMTDINPQWRLKILTERFGICGFGWKYTIKRVWREDAANNEVFAFAEIELAVKDENGQWSEPIPGIGGSKLVSAERENTLYANDEGYKMAITDAISVAAKALGIGADVYMGLWDGSKYCTEPTKTSAISMPQKAFSRVNFINSVEKFLPPNGLSQEEYNSIMEDFGIVDVTDVGDRSTAELLYKKLKMVYDARRKIQDESDICGND